MTLLLPESLQAHVCTLSFLLVLFPLPLYCPLLSSSSPSHTHRHTQTLVFWFKAPFCSSQRPPFCSCFSLHARPVALPAPTFPRATLFCGSLLISLQFFFCWFVFQHFRPTFFFLHDLLCVPISYCLNNRIFLENNKREKKRRKTALYFVLPHCHGLDLGPEASPQPSCSHVVLSEAEAMLHCVTSCIYLQICCMT